MNWKLVASIVVGVIASSLVVVAFAAPGSNGPSVTQGETQVATETAMAATSTETNPTETATEVAPTETVPAPPTETPGPPDDETTTKIEICHLPPGNLENEQTISVREDALDAHLAHGDVEGACVSEGSAGSGSGESSSVKVDVCHVPPGNPDNARTISIGEAALEDHLEHGDSDGACP